MTPAEHAPHSFVGRLDRWCEVCNRPDRDSIHKVATPAEHAATVREHLPSDYLGPDHNDPMAGERWGIHPEALDALAALVVEAERATELEAERDAWMHRFHMRDRRATELERDRDKARNDAALLKDEGDVFLRNVRRLEKRAERAETALREIASEVGPRPGGAGRRFWNIARAALGETTP